MRRMRRRRRRRPLAPTSPKNSKSLLVTFKLSLSRAASRPPTPPVCQIAVCISPQHSICLFRMLASSNTSCHFRIKPGHPKPLFRQRQLLSSRHSSNSNRSQFFKRFYKSKSNKSLKNSPSHLPKSSK